MPEITMPRLSDTMQEGTLARWLKQPGERVEKGDTRAEIETDKATMEVESYAAGGLEKLRVEEGQRAPIGRAIGGVGAGGGAGGGAWGSGGAGERGSGDAKSGRAGEGESG